MRNITFNLNANSIDSAIAELELLKQDIQKTIHNFLQYLLDYGVTIAKANVKNIDTGATLNSIKGMFINNDKGVIIAGANAIWLEFGTGVYWNKSNYPMPLPSGISEIGNYGKGHGKLDGWFYPSTDPRYELVDKNGFGRGIAYTHGIKANKFLYETLVALRTHTPKWAKSWFNKIAK